ncbi:DNA-directed DNA polymerase [Acididesulfobacillus acetoxydans]|uniref:DNA-directed DNA polymerase n=1 Tax=Acididesulfobacillus acetoxydans TaxID=1561005 RepID=A0A8S0XZH0_9FIRM|nr:PHP domain-containing protein [Acididesulfobacillus acetoxydans]CAA7602487.1 DNA-directed DNA polymerase [Acididesulfobacillus acetoxydans]CEJ05942.1 PHP domain protein [Acididesulfobacillus acetoxydans]
MAAEVQADLHCHTTASDGLFTPGDVVRLAARIGLRAVGITDHDTIAGWEEAETVGEKTGVEIVRGIELNTEWQGREVHILGYQPDGGSALLRERLASLRLGREGRIRRILERLSLLGIEIEPEEISRVATGESVGRPHVAQVLIAHGCVGSIGEAFERYLGRGAPAYVPRPKLTPEEGIGLVRAAGGVAVLAHPGLGGLAGRIPFWVTAGLQGVEVYHSEHREAEERALYKIALDLNLIMTGGSDFHGEKRKPAAKLGGWGVSMAVVRQIKEWALSQRLEPEKLGC